MITTARQAFLVLECGRTKYLALENYAELYAVIAMRS